MTFAAAVLSPQAMRDGGRRLAAQSSFVLLVALTGAGMGLVAVAFEELLKQATTLFFGRLGQVNLGATLLDRPYIALLPALGGLLVGLYYLLVVRKRAGHGVTEVLVALETRQGRLPWISGVHTALASSLTIGSGGSAGPEGPIIAIGAALASGLGQLLRLPPQRLRLLLAAGAGAGLAGIYQAPLTGAAFAAEVLLDDLDPRNFSLLAVAAVAANAVAGQFHVEPPVTVPTLAAVPWQSVPLDALLGLIAAPFGVALLVGVHALDRRISGIALPVYIKPALGGLLVGVVGLLLPRVLGSGQSGIDAALHDQIGFGLLLALPLAKLTVTSLTLGSGATGGVFTPSLFIGATLGGAYGVAVRHLWPGAGPEPAFVLVGMGTVVAAVVNAPLTAMLLVCEFVHDFSLLPQVVAAVAVSVALARRLHPDSIYTLPLSLEGIDLRLFRRSPLARIRVRDVLITDWPVAAADDLLALALERARASAVPVLPVLGADTRLLGVLPCAPSLPLAELTIDDRVGAALVRPQVVVAPDDSLHQALLALGGAEPPQSAAPVVEDGAQYCGMIDAATILRAYSAVAWPNAVRRRTPRLPIAIRRMGRGVLAVLLPCRLAQP